MLLHILSIELYNIELSPMYPNEVCIEDAIRCKAMHFVTWNKQNYED